MSDEPELQASLLAWCSASSMYPSCTAQRYKQFLENRRIFVHDENDIRIDLWKYAGGLASVGKPSWVQVCGLAELQRQLQDPTSHCNEASSLNEEQVLNQMLFIGARSGLGPLQINKSMLDKILSHFQVRPGFLDLLRCFDNTFSTGTLYKYPTFSASWLQGCSTKHSISLRSEQGQAWNHDLYYNIHWIHHKDQKDKHHWSIREMAVYHQANLFTGKTAWIVVGASEELQSQVVKTLPAKGDTNSESFKDLLLGNVLDTHLMIALWAQDNWSWYLQSLEEVYSKMMLSVNGIHYGSRTLLNVSPTLRRMRDLEEKFQEVDHALRANAEIFEKTLSWYQELAVNISGTKTDNSSQHNALSLVQCFAKDLGQVKAELENQLSRAKIIKESISDKLQAIHLQFTADAAIIGELESMRMAEMTEKMQEIAEVTKTETVAVRIITVLTLVYLPSSFVTTLFGTTLLNHWLVGDGEPDSLRSFQWWLGTVAILSCITGLIYALWNWNEKRRSVRISNRERSPPNRLLCAS